MIDTHSHLNFEDFQDDCAEIIRRGFDNGVEKIINVGSRFATSQRAAAISEEFDPTPFRQLHGNAKDILPEGCGVYASVGLHPSYVSDEEFEVEKFRELAKNEKVVAVGETGLDYFRITNQESRIKNLQKELFLKHLELAKEFNLPLILHCRGSKENPRDAYEDLIKILQATSYKPQATLHCFSADWEMARKFLELGFYVGFTGNITYPVKKPDSPGAKLLEVVKNAPLDRILTETDCPYLAPQPVRGERNEPRYVKFILEKIAEVKGLSFKEVEKATVKNAEELFGM